MIGVVKALRSSPKLNPSPDMSCLLHNTIETNDTTERDRAPKVPRLPLFNKMPRLELILLWLTRWWCSLEDGGVKCPTRYFFDQTICRVNTVDYESTVW
jgi:hypothetical protein